MPVFKRKTFGKKPFGDKPSYAARNSRPTFVSRDSDGPVERHQATCNECGKMCEVPFKPNGKKPVYCRDCFRKEDVAQSRTRFSAREAAAPGYDRSIPVRTESPVSGDLTKQFNALNAKLDKLIAVIEAQTQAISES